MENFVVAAEIVLDEENTIQSYPTGSIIARVTTTIPNGWLLCDGSPVNVSDYPNLFNILGYTHGGSGSSFKLPPMVMNATHNPNMRIPFSIKSSELSYPNTFGHAHNVSVNATSFGDYNHVHDHNKNTHTTANADADHSHNAGGSTSASNATGGNSNGRLAGPAGPYASGPSGGTSHSHGAVNGASNGTNGYRHTHAHNITVHNNTNHTHNHSSNVSSVSLSTPQLAQYPLSKQVYFLIKT